MHLITVDSSNINSLIRLVPCSMLRIQYTTGLTNTDTSEH